MFETHETDFITLCSNRVNFTMQEIRIDEEELENIHTRFTALRFNSI